MKPLKPLDSSRKLVPLLPKNKLASSDSYETLLDDWLGRSRSHHTIRMYRSNIKALFQWLGVELTPDNLAQFLLLDGNRAFELASQYQVFLLKQDLTPSTVNLKISSIKSLIAYANQVGKCYYNLTNLKAQNLKPYRDTKGISFEEFKDMLSTVDTKSIKGMRDWAILLLLWGNALRRSELVNCDKKDYSCRKGELKIVGKGKIGEPETIALGKNTVAAIDEWLEVRGKVSSDDPLFCAVHKGYWGHRLNTHSIYKLVQKYARAAGIDKVMSPHRIRHSSITEALNLTNGDVRAVQKLSRHSNLNTLMIYDDNRQNLQSKVTGMLDELF